ncbi:MAG: hypothetical protein JSW00_10245 [Thermoplasmata archaeon]|nr:MAG: hypothetical protein JSW00_10245 [Thermoplasmata archaeon]
MDTENEVEPKMKRYYPIAHEYEKGDLPDFTLKNIAMGFILLGLITIMVNLLMVYLFVRQEWAMIGPGFYFAGAGVILICIGTAMYLANRFLERRSD